MTDAAFVVLRELAELMLLLGAVQALLSQHRRADLSRAIGVGTVSGAAVGLAALVALSGSPLGPTGGALAALALGAATLWLALSMLSSARTIESHVENRLVDLLDSAGAFAAVAALCAFAALRETLELGVFLHAVAAREGAAVVAEGALLGVAAAGAAGLAFRSMWGRLRLAVVYRASTLVLCFVSIELLLSAAVELVLQGASSPWLAPLQSTLASGETEPRVAAIALAASALPALWLARRWWRETAR